jgi:hypothetical protein
MIGEIGKVLLAGHLMENMQPILFTARDHVRRKTRAGKGSWEGYLRAGKRRFHESFPPSRFAKLRVIPTLASHGGKIERAALL